MTETVAAVPFDDAMSRYEPVFGLETHVELGTTTKMFCGCPAAFGAEPNAAVCPVCLGLPGSLPVVNRRAVVYRSVEQLSEELRRAAGGAKEPMVVISADANATHQAVIRVMEAARLAGLSQITFTTQSQK